MSTLEFVEVPPGEDPFGPDPEPLHQCGPCSRGELTNPDGSSRRFHLVVEDGRAGVECPEEGCSGVDFGDLWESLGTENPIPVNLAVDAPPKNHYHPEQFGCDCDVYLTMNPAEPEPPIVTADMDPVDRLSTLLPGLHLRWVRSLARAGVRELEDMRGWTVGDVRDLPYVGDVGVAAIVTALGKAGVMIGPVVVPEGGM